MPGTARPKLIAPASPGVWLALAAVLTLLMSPLLAGRSVAEPMAMPIAAVHRVPCRTCSDPLCAAACALSAQLVIAEVLAAEAPQHGATAVDYPVFEVQPAGTTPQQELPPPR